MKKLLLIVLILIIGAFLVTLFIPSRQIYEFEPGNSVITQTEENVPKIPAVLEDGWEVASGTPVASSLCAKSLSDEIKKNKTEYEPSSVLVSFPSGTSLKMATTILEPHNLSIDPNKSSNFSTLSWGTVTVPKGKEIETVCLLRADDKIRHATLNTLLELHQ